METLKELIGARSRKLILCVEASHALRSVVPAGARVIKMSVGFGPNSYVVFARFNPDGCLLKMYGDFSQQTVDGNLEKFCEGFPEPGMMLNGACFQPRMLELPIYGNGCSSWRSPAASDGEGGNREYKAVKGGIYKLMDQGASWPTPDATVSEGYNQSDSPGAAKRPALAGKVKDWPTPDAVSGEHSGRKTSSEGQVHLPEMANNWATPTSRDHKDGSNPSELCPTKSLLGRQAPRSGISGPKSSSDGPSLRRRWSSPTCGDTGEKQTPNSRQGLIREVREPGDNLRLNPSFVEWLMGFPVGWTDLDV